MPITVPEGLPAIQVLEKENIFVMTEPRAYCEDIRPLKILILNLMPTKVETETQLLRLLGSTPLQVEVELLQRESGQTRGISGRRNGHRLLFITYSHSADYYCGCR